jgi:hypothetical protein
MQGHGNLSYDFAKKIPAIDETLMMADFFLYLCFLSWKMGM